MSGELEKIFSRQMRAGAIGALAQRRVVAATPAECKALAAVFGLPGIAELEGDFTLATAKGRGGVIEAELALQAKVTQICVVSLEAFDSKVTERAKLRFVPAASVHEDAEISELDPASLEGPDEIPYAGDVIDLGAVLAEQLALTLDPYPRKPGAELPAEATDAAANPFAALAALRGKPAKDQA